MTDGICLSIVIPIYNAGAYLRQCMESLLASDGIEDTQIILVDDGSSDDSGAIAEEYASGHSNITVFHKENGGPSAARNLGLIEASGRYVFFCDSDDEVDPVIFKKIISLTRTCDEDMILWDADLRYETWNLLVPKNRDFFSHGGLKKTEQVYTGKELVETLLRSSGDFVATIWLGTYRREFLTGNGLFFEEGLIHEDELLLPKIFLAAASVRYIPEKAYIYRIHEGSIMNPGTMDRKKSSDALMYIYPSLYEYYDEVLDGEPLKILIEGNLTKRYLHMIYKYRIWRYGYKKQIDRKLLWRTSVRMRDRAMVLLLYLFIH